MINKAVIIGVFGVVFLIFFHSYFQLFVFGFLIILALRMVPKLAGLILLIVLVVGVIDSYQAFTTLMNPEKMQAIVEKGENEALVRACSGVAVGNQEDQWTREIAVDATKGVHSYLEGRPIGGMANVFGAATVYANIQIKALEMFGSSIGTITLAMQNIETACNPPVKNGW